MAKAKKRFFLVKAGKHADAAGKEYPTGSIVCCDPGTDLCKTFGKDKFQEVDEGYEARQAEQAAALATVAENGDEDDASSGASDGEGGGADDKTPDGGDTPQGDDVTADYPAAAEAGLLVVKLPGARAGYGVFAKEEPTKRLNEDKLTKDGVGPWVDAYLKE